MTRRNFFLKTARTVIAFFIGWKYADKLIPRPSLVVPKGSLVIPSKCCGTEFCWKHSAILISLTKDDVGEFRYNQMREHVLNEMAHYETKVATGLEERLWGDA